MALLCAALVVMGASPAKNKRADPILPNKALTPGATFTNLTIDTLRVSGYTKTVRDVPEKLKRQVFQIYGIAPSGDYEIDHLISLCLGGNNSIKNLWPQSYKHPFWNAYRKDALEHRLFWLVKHDRLPLKEAQHVIACDWTNAYRRFCWDLEEDRAKKKKSD